MRNKEARNNEARAGTEAGIGQIVATVREPDDEAAAVLVIHPATATPERFYGNFASYLADNGIATVTYDYRGTGRSGSPRANRSIGMRDWITSDVPAVTAWTADRFPGLPQLAIGHSVGGHALALGYAGDGPSGLVILASHAASYRAIPDPAERRRVRILLHGVGPALAATLGYVPARRLGLGEDIPAAAMRQWGEWARLENYFFDDPGMDAAARAATVTQPVLAVGFTDDKWATPSSIDNLTGRLVAAPVERRTYSPADGGVDAIGHHGFLRRGVRDTLWPELLTWLQKHVR